MSTILLVLIYVIVSAAAQAYGGTKLLTDNSNDVLSVLGTNVFGTPWDKLLIIAVLTSASASTQTTILPTARTSLSMARKGAIPKAFASIHPKNLTPDVSTIVMGAVSIVWTVGVMALNPAQSVLGDSITALGFGICFYYGFTAFACVLYYRREIFKSARNFLLVGVVPLLGGLMLFGIFIKAFTFYSRHTDSSGATINYAKPIFGIEVPIFIGIGGLLLGVLMMFVAMVPYRDFFRRKPYTEVATPGILEVPVERAPMHFEGRNW